VKQPSTNQMSELSEVKRQLQDRWTVLSHRKLGDKSARGAAPESWNCVDCGVNTAPGMLTRKELDAAFLIHASADNVLTWEQEVYTVTTEVWRASGLEGWGGCLCVGCLERRIGRKLRPQDFVPDHEFNQPWFPASRRLRERRGC
jgi:hypothetical protein